MPLRPLLVALVVAAMQIFQIDNLSDRLAKYVSKLICFYCFFIIYSFNLSSIRYTIYFNDKSIYIILTIFTTVCKLENTSYYKCAVNIILYVYFAHATVETNHPILNVSEMHSCVCACAYMCFVYMCAVIVVHSLCRISKRQCVTTTFLGNQVTPDQFPENWVLSNLPVLIVRHCRCQLSHESTFSWQDRR